MKRRFEVRKQELLAECRVEPRVFENMVERLRDFAQPFVDCLWRCEQKKHAQTYLAGLLSDLERKNVESIAYRHDQECLPLQRFVGVSPWEHQPLLAELTRQVGREIGEADGVIVFDPSGFPKKGKNSVGVKRQWLGRLGKVDNGQVAVYMGYASRQEQALVNERLFLPRKWAKDRKRRKKCGVPREIQFQTRHKLALEMLEESGSDLPHAWVAGDNEMGRPTAFRRDLRALGERYLLAVPANTGVRDLEETPPPYKGKGARPKPPFRNVTHWRKALAEEAWTRVDVRDGEKGPLVMEIAKTRVQARTERGRGRVTAELLVVTRAADENGMPKHDYYLSNASPDTSLEELARVAKAEHRIEECIERGKSEAGLADYEVRSWHGWHHHQTLSFIATWFLNHESRRGKKIHARAHGAAGPQGAREAAV